MTDTYTEIEEPRPKTLLGRIQHLGRTHSLGADSDSVADVIEPGDGPDGEPLSGEIGVGDGTVEPPVPPGPGPARAAVRTATADALAVVVAEQPSSWRAYSRTMPTDLAVRIAEANPRRMSIDITPAAASSGIRIGASAAEATSASSSVSVDNLDRPMTHTAEVWAYVASGTPSLDVVETYRSAIPTARVG